MTPSDHLCQIVRTDMRKLVYHISRFVLAVLLWPPANRFLSGVSQLHSLRDCRRDERAYRITVADHRIYARPCEDVEEPLRELESGAGGAEVAQIVHAQPDQLAVARVQLIGLSEIGHVVDGMFEAAAVEAATRRTLVEFGQLA